MNSNESNELSNAASVMGQKGGSATSPAKQVSSRENGKSGGRPQRTTGKIISKPYALQLIRDGKASVSTPLKPDSNGRVYVAINRHDLHVTDHYED